MAPVDELISAIENKNNDQVCELLRRLDVATVNSTDITGCGPLHYACKYNNSHAVALLLAMQGIKVNTRDMNGDTPIVLAAWCASVEALRIMLGDSRVDVEARV